MIKKIINHIDLESIKIDSCTTKRFDLAIKTDKQVYVIETNFYVSDGSILNETARSYKILAEELKKVDGATLIWFTDVLGWKSVRRNLE